MKQDVKIFIHLPATLNIFKERPSNAVCSCVGSNVYSSTQETECVYSTAFVYGQDGQRSNKYTGNSETLYFNKMWTHHTDSGNSIYGGQTSKNIYLGETRIVTKLNSGKEPTYQEEYYKQYYYHSDHLGSASLISDYKGDEYQRIEYTPYGETWVEKTSNTGLEYLPYKFTAKELDEETGLYYYGARYLDPKYSMWISTDPALGEYIPQAPVNEEAKRYNQNLPGMGGVFNHINGNLYHYAGNNPVKYTDPDGRETYDSEITEEQYNKSNFLQRQMSWEEVQNFFGENPNGVLHRPEDQIGFMKLESKKDIIDINDGSMLMVDILLIGRGLFSLGKSLLSLTGKSIAKKTAIEVTEHGAARVAERGFTQERMAEIISKGVSEISPSRYGTQTKYILGKNTVVFANDGINKGKVITAFSSETVNGIKGYWVKP